MALLSVILAYCSGVARGRRRERGMRESLVRLNAAVGLAWQPARHGPALSLASQPISRSSDSGVRAA
jgi:hypothetical protein